MQTFLPIAMILVAAVALTPVFPFRQMFAQESTVALTSDRLAVLQAENALLEKQIAALSTDTELERIARQDLGYVREGEIAYVITAPSDYVPEVVVEPVLPERRPWWKVVADFLTGEDLVAR